MKTYYKIGCVALACVSAACVSPNSTTTEPSTTTTTIEAPVNDYQKPGAAITFSHVSDDKTAVSASGTLKLSLTESYDEGSITLSVTGTEGLEIFSSSTAFTLDVAGKSTHEMNIYYSADADGKYYVNLQAKAPDGRVRAHAIAVVIGDLSKAAQKPRTERLDVDSEGNPIIVMDAEETIQ